MLINRLPKVSCLLVTTGRVSHAKESVACFQRQTYPNKELILLSQGDADANDAIWQSVREMPNVQYFPAHPRLSLGAMRNLSCELASGPILCQWDDDDLYFPTRITDQVKALQSYHKNSASAFSKFLKYFVNTQELYWCDWSGEGAPTSQFLCGSVMFYKRFFHQHKSYLYPEVGHQSDCEEDLNVLGKLLKAGNVQEAGFGHQYCYQYHGSNTYDLDHHRLTLRLDSGKHVASKEQLEERQGLIEHTLQVAGLTGPIAVRSIDEVAFTYETV